MLLRDGDASSHVMQVLELGLRVKVGLCLGPGHDGTRRDGMPGPRPAAFDGKRQTPTQKSVAYTILKHREPKPQDTEPWTYTRWP